MRPRPIVVVDDDSDFGMLLRLSLPDALRTRLRVFVDSAAAWDAARDAAVVVADLKMNPVDGLSWLESLRAAGAECPLLLWTSWPVIDPPMATRMQLADITFVQKSSDLSRLLESMNV